jgi:hypothetical protein
MDAERRGHGTILRVVFLGDLDLRVAVVVERERDQVGAAAHRAVFRERLPAAAARIGEELVLFAAERAGIAGQAKASKG